MKRNAVDAPIREANNHTGSNVRLHLKYWEGAPINAVERFQKL
jgi:hypothetical protein